MKNLLNVCIAVVGTVVLSYGLMTFSARLSPVIDAVIR